MNGQGTSVWPQLSVRGASWVGKVGVEPTHPGGVAEFKSAASSDSATCPCCARLAHRALGDTSLWRVITVTGLFSGASAPVPARAALRCESDRLRRRACSSRARTRTVCQDSTAGFRGSTDRRQRAVLPPNTPCMSRRSRARARHSVLTGQRKHFSSACFSPAEPEGEKNFSVSCGVQTAFCIHAVSALVAVRFTAARLPTCGRTGRQTHGWTAS